jgi:hypothetical protein
VTVAVRPLVEVLASTQNTIDAVPTGPVLLDAATQLGKPDSDHPVVAFVVTTVEAFPLAAGTVTEVGDNDRVAVTPA